MKQALLLFSSILIAGCSNFSTEWTEEIKDNCDAYKTGKYLYTAFSSHVLIDRNDTLQVETNLDTRNKIYYKITWTGPCTYNLTFLSTTEHLSDFMLKDKKSAPLIVSIINGDDSYYFYESKRSNSALVYKDTIWARK